MSHRSSFLSLLIFLLLLALAACAPAATTLPIPVPTQVVVQTKVVESTKSPQPTPAPAVTQSPLPSATGIIPATAAPTSVPQLSATPASLRTPTPPLISPQPTGRPTSAVDQRMVELEWPARLRLGESDLVRLSVVPFQGGYVVQVEFPEHKVTGTPVIVTRLPGFTISGVARLDGVGFEIAPAAEVEQPFSTTETITWRWSLRPRAAGTQRLSVSLWIHYLPEANNPAPEQRLLAFSRGLDVQVASILGLSQGQATAVGLMGLVLGVAISAGAALRPQVRRAALRIYSPNPRLAIEPVPGIVLDPGETQLVQALFGKYDRLVMESEFISGYSGARTFLALPVLPDGRADALTIIKIGWREDILAEAENYEQFVKNTLPPMTARIQREPISFPGSEKAAIQYTFITEPGRRPISLRQALLADPDPALIHKLFDTFGPHWWMQRHAEPFRVAVEYDRLLPPHLVLEPLAKLGGKAGELSKEAGPELQLEIGQELLVRRFDHWEKRADGASYTLFGQAERGRPPLRIRWQSHILPNRTPARVVATRASLYNLLTTGCERFDLPDPLQPLPAALEEVVQGTRSIIHGDLNLENVLVGPGGFVWMIDFARTRMGHPLFDFSHLAAEIISQVIAPLSADLAAYLAELQSGIQPLLAAVEQEARRCLFNPADVREYHLGLYLACLGALKFNNLSQPARRLLYLTAAFYSQAIH